MLLPELNGKTVCILGFGREGRAVLAAIERDAPNAEVTIADANPDIEVPEKHWKQVGEGWLANLQHFDVIIRSPGVFPRPELEKVQHKITNSTQIFCDTAQQQGVTVIGVTGSKGKSTTSSLIHHIFKNAGKNALLLGNIGEPAIAHLDELQESTTVVLEMSSYQLMDMKNSPSIAVITAFFPEHLDYHGSLQNYWNAKANIARFQEQNDVVFYDAASEKARAMAELSPGRKVPFTLHDCPLAISETHLIGAHNIRNIGAAFLVARSQGIESDVCMDAIRSFEPLPHRLQFLGDAQGIRWVNDAISTTPESAIAAMEAVGNRVGTLIAGGQDRGYDFSALAAALAASSIQTVILLPESGQKIAEALKKAGATQHILRAATMQEAVHLGAEHTEKGGICLLSPASPSYGMFKNFEERGKAFIDAIRAL